MMVQAEVSLYPLGDDEFSDRINALIENINNAGLEIEVGRMSSVISGECTDVFRILGEVFDEDCERGASVMTIKVSNACPSG